MVGISDWLIVGADVGGGMGPSVCAADGSSVREDRDVGWVDLDGVGFSVGAGVGVRVGVNNGVSVAAALGVTLGDHDVAQSLQSPSHRKVGPPPSLQSVPPETV